MHIEKHDTNGSILISDLRGNQLINRRYFYFTMDEAIQEFLNEFPEEDAVIEIERETEQ